MRRTREPRALNQRDSGENSDDSEHEVDPAAGTGCADKVDSTAGTGGRVAVDQDVSDALSEPCLAYGWPPRIAAAHPKPSLPGPGRSVTEPGSAIHRTT